MRHAVSNIILRGRVSQHETKPADNAASISETLHEMHHYGFTGYESGAVHFDWGHIQRARDEYIERLNGIYDRNMMNSNVARLRGVASLMRSDDCDGLVVLVSHDGKTTRAGSTNSTQQQTTYRARHVLLATGGYPAVPPDSHPSIARHAISSDGFFDLKTLPRKSVVVGAGYIAVELAGVLQSLGSDTTLVLRKGRALRNFDDLLSETLDSEMERHGIDIRRNTDGVDQIVHDESSGIKTVMLKNGGIIEDVDVVIMATGRSPLVESLNLQEVGVVQRDGGYIDVNEYSETNVERLYAIGDVCGNVELTPMGEFWWYFLNASC